MAKLGYARVSTDSQDLTAQINALVKSGVKNHADYLFTDKLSGKDTNRPSLEMLLLKSREGDHILVTKLDRLGRNTADMISIIDTLYNKGVTISFIHEGISTTGSMGKMVITILAAVAEAERNRLLERVREGRSVAIQNGVKMGRKNKFSLEQQQEILKKIEAKIPLTIISKQMSASRATIYKIKNGTY